ncbi:cytidine deaminase [Streptomyces triticagri]|uniref:Cytidine deaminase n=1 Tax=Streptomyces triticagri TaxID=2293568 RepID=A0A372M5Y9_9ACTN|nr:cytidine deaminase [Streptomyces triticagri]RFU86259.1 cytidine deaminase [Streptomyces triticagri]
MSDSEPPPVHAREVDHELVSVASHLADTACRGDNHSMAAAARARDGRIVTGLNVYHFTGGPCAELVAIGAGASEGVYDLVTMVAVGSDGRGVMPPCGRCRQVLLDCHPALEVIVQAADGAVIQVPVTDLLPYAYVWDEDSAPN